MKFQLNITDRSSVETWIVAIRQQTITLGYVASDLCYQYFWCKGRNGLGELNQYHCRWCSGSLRRLVIKSQASDYVKYTVFVIPDARTTFAIREIQINGYVS